MDELTRNILRSSPFTIIQASLLGSLVTGDKVGILFALGYYIFVEVFNRSLKNITFSNWPNYTPFMRPNMPKDGCNNYATINPEVGWGMPSGHSQGVCFAAVFWIMYVNKKTNLTKNKKMVLSTIIALLAIIVMYSRYIEGCHNPLQITVGGIIGSIIGYLFYKLINN
jgi:membrane-associated phospholipid phosphatase